MAAALTPLAAAFRQGFGNCSSRQGNHCQIHLTRNIRQLRETRHARNLGILRIDRIDVAGVAVLAEEAKGSAAKLVLLCGGADQRHRTGVKQILEVQGLCQFYFFPLHCSDFRVVTRKTEPVTPSTPFALSTSKGSGKVYRLYPLQALKNLPSEPAAAEGYQRFPSLCVSQEAGT